MVGTGPDGTPPLAGEGTGARFVVLGASGSGKTTMAARLARRLGVRHVELDALHWEPRWTEAPTPVFRSRVDQALSGPHGWVVDGNYRKARDLVWPRAGVVVWLDYALPLVLFRITWRSVRRLVVPEELWQGNRESWRLLLSRRSIVLYALQTHAKLRREYPALFDQPEFAHLRVVHLRSPRAAERWLATVRPTRS